VDHTVPANDIVYFPPPLAAAAFFDVSHMPMETTQSEQITRGKYLVRMACIDCHTQLTDPNDWRSIDETKLLAGARDFPRAFLGLPDTFPEHIYSMNLTPHDPTGIYLYDAADIIKVLKMGIDGEGNGVCPPMPGGPMAAFGGLTDADAADIAAYIDALPANEQARPNECSVPLGP